MLIFVLSSLKIVWGAFLGYFCLIKSSQSIWIIIFIGLIVISDILDGVVARLIRKDSAARRLFDNLTDAVITNFSFLVIIYYLDWSFWWYIPLLVRDGFMSLGGLFLLRGQRVVVFPGIFHKIARLSLAAAAVLMVIGFMGEIFLVFALFLFYLSSFDYYGYFKIFMRQVRKTDKISEAGLTLDELHLNSSLNGLRALRSNQKLLASQEMLKRR